MKTDHLGPKVGQFTAMSIGGPFTLKKSY